MSDVPRTGWSPEGRTNIILDKAPELLIMERLGDSSSIKTLPPRPITQNRNEVAGE